MFYSYFSNRQWLKRILIKWISIKVNRNLIKNEKNYSI